MSALLASVLLLAGLVSGALGRAAGRNAASLLLLRGLAGDAPAVEQTLGRLSSDHTCWARWLRGLAYHALGDIQRRDEQWGAFLACEPAGAALIEAYLPEDRSWAERAVALAPEEAESWFWLARLAERKEPALAAEAYRQGLERNPYDAMRWQSYGFVLMRTAGEEEALQAFIRSCQLGGNGCRRVGSIMERRGDLRTAIEYYRADPSPTFQRYADELERRLGAQESSR
ncbi:MAG: hypothetical protein ACUVT1_14205 [Anaerolineae bacterium]